MLHFSWDARFDGKYVPIDDRVVDEVNRTTEWFADKQIVACKNETRDLWFQERAAPADAWKNTDEAKSVLREHGDAA
jgi:hypothetical protein